MAKLDVGRGISSYTSNLEKILQSSDELIGKAIYPGAGIVADAINGAIDSIPPATYRRKGNTTIVRGITDEQREGLKNGFGISSMRNDGGFVNVKLGFHGYNAQVTKKYPNGQPNALIASACEAGSSYRQRTAFVAQAVNANKAAAEEAIATKFDELIEKYSN